MLVGFIVKGVLTCVNCMDGFTMAFNDETQEGVVPLHMEDLDSTTFVGEQKCDKCSSTMFTVSEGYKATHGEAESTLERYAVVLKQTRFVLCHTRAESDELAKEAMNFEDWEERDFVVDSDEVVSIVNLATGKTILNVPQHESPFRTPDEQEAIRRGMEQIG
jgi:hypothetical protein